MQRMDFLGHFEMVKPDFLTVTCGFAEQGFKSIFSTIFAK